MTAAALVAMATVVVVVVGHGSLRFLAVLL
jgi:hypothetical protein